MTFALRLRRRHLAIVRMLYLVARHQSFVHNNMLAVDLLTRVIDDGLALVVIVFVVHQGGGGPAKTKQAAEHCAQSRKGLWYFSYSVSGPDEGAVAVAAERSEELPGGLQSLHRVCLVLHHRYRVDEEILQFRLESLALQELTIRLVPEGCS